MRKFKTIPIIVISAALSICLLIMHMLAILLLILNFSTETNAYLEYQKSDIPLSWTQGDLTRKTTTTKSRYHFFNRDWYYTLNNSKDVVIVQNKSLGEDTFSILYNSNKIESPFAVYQAPQNAILSFQNDEHFVESVSFHVDNVDVLERFYRELCEAEAISTANISDWKNYTTDAGSDITVSLSFYELTFSLVEINGDLFWHLPAWDTSKCWLIAYNATDFGVFLEWYNALPTMAGVRA